MPQACHERTSSPVISSARISRKEGKSRLIMVGRRRGLGSSAEVGRDAFQFKTSSSKGTLERSGSGQVPHARSV